MGCSSSVEGDEEKNSTLALGIFGNQEEYKHHPKQNLKVDIIRAFRKNIAFRVYVPSIVDALLEKIVQSMYLVNFEKNKLLFKFGDAPNSCYFISSGKVVVYDEQMNEVEAHTEDEFIGEIPFILKTPHNNNYGASKRTMAYKLDRVAFENVVKSVDYLFGQISLFSQIEMRYRLEFLKLCSVHGLEKNEIAIGEGSKLPSGGFYYIVKGLLMLVNAKLQLKEKMYFGHEALLGFETSNESIRAVEPATIFFVSKKGFDHQGFASVKDDLERNIKSRRANIEETGSPSPGLERRRSSKRSRKSKSRSFSLAEIEELKQQSSDSGVAEPTPSNPNAAACAVLDVVPAFSLPSLLTEPLDLHSTGFGRITDIFPR